MEMSTTDRPVLGTTVNSTITGIPGSATLGYVGFSYVPYATPGLDLTSVGAPGCYLLGDTSEVLPITITGSTETVSLAIPTDVTLGGNTLYTQAIAIAPGSNQLGVVLSGGLAWTLGEN